MTIQEIPMQLVVEASERKADLYINGDITRGFQWFGFDMGQDSDVAYQDVVEALSDLPEDVSDIYVHINSYGGEVAEGVAIYNALRSSSAKVTTVCEGFACSIASVIFMAGEDRIMRDSSLLMLHNASMGAHGDAHALRKAADDLDVITELSKTAYLSHATESLTRERLTEVMDHETWVLPEQALEWGLCTEVFSAGGGDEPSQSARQRVLTDLTARRPVGDGYLEQFRQIFTRMDELEQLITATPTPVAPTEPEPDPEPEPKPINERASRLFRQLAEVDR